MNAITGPLTGRAAELITLLRLQPRPEGGFYREVYRAAARVRPDDGRAARSALTNIHFLLARGGFSRWHRVSSSETWHWHEGSELELWVAPPDLREVARVRLGRAAVDVRPCYTLPPGWWQAARPAGEYVLVSCSVGPGFEFEDFGFLRDDATLVERLGGLDPEAVALL